MVTSGPSDGGPLALWLADRGKIPTGSELYVPNPLPVKGVFALAPAANLEGLHAAGVCDGVVDRLMGGPPTSWPQRYAVASPMQLAPLSVPGVLFVGAHDETWGPGGTEYYQRTI